MASENWQSAPDLGSHLSREAKFYSFFQAIELIQRLHNCESEPGNATMPGLEKIVFAVNNNMNFPTSDIHSIQLLQRPEGFLVNDQQIEPQQYKITVNFLGLHGSSSPLPSYYGESVARYDEHGSLLKDFFDFYHNRLLGLMYRIMRKYRYYRLFKPSAGDSFSQRVFSLFGLGNKQLRDSTQIHWARLLCFAGVLSARNRSPDLIAHVIQHAFFLENVSINEWIFRKVDIHPSQKWSLGRKNTILGRNSVIGDRVRDIRSKFQIHIKDIDYQRFGDFLPSGKDYFPLKKLVEFMLKDQFSYELKLGLKSNESRPLTLNPNETGRLGWSSFLGRGEAGRKEVLITVRH